MKKSLFVLLALTTLFCISCQNDVEVGNGETEITKLLEKTSVKLFEGVDISEIGISAEEKQKLLEKKLSEKIGRNIDNTDLLLTNEEMVNIIERKISNITIPELITPTEDDIALIQKDFEGLSKQEIIRNIDTIAQIYQDQVSALTIDGILEDDMTLKIATNIDRARDMSIDTEKVTYNDNELSWNEIGVILKYPFCALTLTEQTKLATTYTNKYMPSNIALNNKADAFRHAIWNVAMAKESWGKKKTKLSWAKEFSEAHEKSWRYREYESEMDLHNNKVGQDFYNDNSTQKTKKIIGITFYTGVTEPSYEEACIFLREKALYSYFINKEIELEDFKNTLTEISVTDLVYIVNDVNTY